MWGDSEEAGDFTKTIRFGFFSTRSVVRVPLSEIGSLGEGLPRVQFLPCDLEVTLRLSSEIFCE